MSVDLEKKQLEQILSAMTEGKTSGVSELGEMLDKNPDNLEVIGHLSWALAHAGRYQDSIDLCNRYLEKVPENVEMQWRRGDRLINLGKLDQAEDIYRTVLKDNPDCVDARLGIRYIHYRRKKNKSGMETVYIQKKRKLTTLQKNNRKLNKKEYKQQRLVLKSKPSELYLESTTKCNFFCKTCSKGYGSYYAEDLRENILDTVKKTVMSTNIRISITGFGEPTLAGDFDEILDMSIKNGSLVHFVTNASLLTYERLEQITSNPVDITISFDGAKKETFESIRAGANFDLILDKLGMIKKLRDIHLSQITSCFRFNFVALHKNIEELEGVVKIAHRYGIKHIGVADYSLNFTDFDNESLRFTPADANRAIRRALKTADKLGIELTVPPRYEENQIPAVTEPRWSKLLNSRRIFPEKNRFPRKCDSPWTEPYICTDGTVLPCCTSGQYLGDMKKHSFARIWNGWRYRLLRWRIHSCLPPLGCRMCFVAWGINGGNAGNIMAKEGLLVKVWYALERRVVTFLEGRRLRKKGNEKPNYEQGRPLSKQGKKKSSN